MGSIPGATLAVVRTQLHIAHPTFPALLLQRLLHLQHVFQFGSVSLGTVFFNPKSLDCGRGDGLASRSDGRLVGIHAIVNDHTPRVQTIVQSKEAMEDPEDRTTMDMESFVYLSPCVEPTSISLCVYIIVHNFAQASRRCGRLAYSNFL